jgi:hypothetical protein
MKKAKVTVFFKSYGKGKDDYEKQRGVLRQRNYFGISIMVYLSLYIYQNSENMQHKEKNLNVNYGMWVMMGKCRFINCNKYTTLTDAGY